MDLFSDSYITRTERGRAGVRASQQFSVVRRVYQQDALDKDADYHKPRTLLGQQCRKLVRNCGFGECLLSSVPAVRWVPRYRPRDHLLGDLIAGATTAVMHIPQGMAYALLAEVPPIVGLYMAFFPALVYVLFGTSPHVSVGTFAVACLMAGKVVMQHSTHHELAANITNTTAAMHDGLAGAPQYSPLQVLAVVTLTVGIFQVSMWALRLGAVSTLLSEPLVSGFTTAASFYVLASQLKDLVGVHVPKLAGNHKVVLSVVEVCRALPQLNWAALVISTVACVVIALNNELLKPWVGRRSRVPVPIELLAIVVGTLVSRYCRLADTYGISLVGNIPTGLPLPVVPPMALVPRVALDAFTITMVTYSITMSMALIFAAKDKYEVDPNQELLALGASNVFGAFFCCAPLCASLSRSYIQYQAGGKTALTTAVSASLVLLVLLWIGPFFELLPRCVLAAIIVVSLKGMFMQVKDLARFWKLSKLDAAVWLVTFLVTALINIDIGLGAGLVASVGALFCRSQTPYTCLLGRVADTDLYLDIKRYRAAEEIPGIKIFHYCGGLNFATKNLFRAALLRKVGCLRPAGGARGGRGAARGSPLGAPGPAEAGGGGGGGRDDDTLTRCDSYEWDHQLATTVQCVVVDATALSYVDAPGVQALGAASLDLAAAGLLLLLAGANGPVLEMIARYNALQPASEQLRLDTFPTVHDAVVYYKVLEARGRPPRAERDAPAAAAAAAAAGPRP